MFIINYMHGNKKYDSRFSIETYRNKQYNEKLTWSDRNFAYWMNGSGNRRKSDEEVAQEMESYYPDIKTEYMFVDNAAMQIIQCPKNFDVMVTENMFGDILTDEASVITGSLGLLPSASMGIHTSVFEPIHGSYPQATGKDIANPIATILSAAMMFEYAFDLKEEGKVIRDAVAASINKNMVTEDIAEGQAFKTSEVGDWIANWISK